ncbi:hypothetical protein KY290_029075 [Solanum tuberosum]|uniref:Uncharacterized protein n=1 Tax=Solanum tuberosum TaxID=4113 RepID=A0ABQ7ULQ0_SOLTU|nr:hypothetical protein KY290_029075 [Solanum tuberosum]
MFISSLCFDIWEMRNIHRERRVDYRAKIKRKSKAHQDWAWASLDWTIIDQKTKNKILGPSSFYYYSMK